MNEPKSASISQGFAAVLDKAAIPIMAAAIISGFGVIFGVYLNNNRLEIEAQHFEESQKALNSFIEQQLHVMEEFRVAALRHIEQTESRLDELEKFKNEGRRWRREDGLENRTLAKENAVAIESLKTEIEAVRLQTRTYQESAKGFDQVTSNRIERLEKIFDRIFDVSSSASNMREDRRSTP